MGNNMFRFKQFDVVQDGCAMKVNTDGVLLGAWAATAQANTLLDIGTGTGVIALMQAQKNTGALIDAIDIDATSAAQAQANFSRSPWRDRLQAHGVALQAFEPGRQYDFILSNPPYFIADLKADDPQKNVAKHTVALTYAELLSGINRLLLPHGKAALVLPCFNVAALVDIAQQEQLFVQRLTAVYAVEGKANPYLALLELGRQPTTYTKAQLFIQDSAGNFTPAYRLLTAAFYLKF